MRILVTGGSGQIGKDLQNIVKNSDLKFYFPSSSEFNLTDENSISSIYDDFSPNLIINLGAFTSVDLAEKERDIALLTNFKGVRCISELAKKDNIDIIQFSTDYVFGEGKGPFRESDIKLPINFYGKTKSLAEDQIIKENKHSLIIRLASVFGETGNNFVRTIINLISKEENIDVIHDQKISLTYSFDIANFIFFLVNQYSNDKVLTKNKEKIIHFSNKGYTNWYEVASEIRKEMKKITNLNNLAEINKIKASQWKSLAKRPNDSRLDVNFSWFEEKGIQIPLWQDRLKKVLSTLLQDK